MNKTLNCIGAKCFQGQKKSGVEKGVDLLYILFEKFLKNTHMLNFTTIEKSEFDDISGYIELFEQHQMLLNMPSSSPVITLGGDHSIGHSTVGSSLNKYSDDLIVIWVDAHADINTHKSSISGNTHGMPVSGLVGLEDNWISDRIPNLKPSNLIYYGIRDLDQAEIDFLNELNIKSFNNFELLIRHLEKINIQDNKIHISFDVDSMDPIFMDSTGTIASGGISPTELINIYKYCEKKSNLVAFDMVELNPLLGTLSKSIHTMEYIIGELFN